MIADAATTPPRQRLATAMRALGHASLDADLADPELDRMAAVIESLAQDLPARPSRPRDPDAWLRGFFPAAVTDGQTLVHFPDCPVSGPDNPLGLGLRASVDGAEVVCELTLGRAHEGAPGRAHGGIVAAAFDDALGYLLTVHEIIAYTGELTVRYHDRVPIGVPLTLRSGIADRSGRSTTMWATATVDRRVVATGHGVFVEGPPDEVDRVRRDVLDRGSTR